MNQKISNKFLVLSGRYPISEFRSSENHKAYCLKNNYFYFHACYPTEAKIYT